MLDDSGSADEDLEPFIVGWETFQENQYSNCKVQYDDTNCKLSSSRRLGVKQQQKKMRVSHNSHGEDTTDEIAEDFGEDVSLLDDLITQDMEQDQRKMAQDYLYPYRLAHKTGPGVSLRN